MFKKIDGKIYSVGEEISAENKLSANQSLIDSLEEVKSMTEISILLAFSFIQAKGNKTFEERCQEEIDRLTAESTEINSLK